MKEITKRLQRDAIWENSADRAEVGEFLRSKLSTTAVDKTQLEKVVSEKVTADGIQNITIFGEQVFL